MANMKEQIHIKGLQPVGWFINKVIQLYEMIVVRHGLMLVGPTGGGKSCNLHVLQDTLGALKEAGVEGFAYEKPTSTRSTRRASPWGRCTARWTAIPWSGRTAS